MYNHSLKQVQPFIESGTAASSSQILSSTDSCFQPGQCTDSFHLSSDFTTDEYACLDNCNQDPLCNWFTFSPTLSLCELLHNCSYIDAPSCSDCMTGQTGCTPGNKSKKHTQPNLTLPNFT